MIPSFNINPGESPQAVAERRKIALLLMKEGMDTSPIRSPWQGAARVAQAMMGGMELNRADNAERATGKRLADALLPELPAGDVTVSPPPAGSAPAPAVSPRPAAPLPPAGAPVAEKIYQNDELSPLDPPSGATKDLATRTVVAEAGNQGMTGMQAVANVLRNRAASGKFGGDTLEGVISAPKQFEPMNTPAGRQRMAAIDPQSQAYQTAARALEKAYAGEDPTRGATHFYAPKAQAALGRPAPSWDNGTGVDIGDHRFFGGAGTPQVTAGMSPSDAVSAQAKLAPQAPAQAPAAPVQDPMRNAPQVPPEMYNKLRQLIADPSTREYGLGLASKYLQPSQAQFTVVSEDAFGNKVYGWADPLRRQAYDVQGRPLGSAPATGGVQTEVGPNGQLRIMGPDGQWIDVKPGQDPKVVRELATKAATKGQLPATFEDTAKVRGEVRQLPSYKNFAEAAPIYKSMVASAPNNSKASDLNLVYGLGKIMDPGSVVREGEMIMVKNTAGIPEWLKGQIEAVNGGASLTPETRKAIMREAKIRIDSYQQMFNQDAEQYRGIAQREKMNVDDVVPNFGEFPEWVAPDQIPMPRPRPDMTAPAPGAPAPAPAAAAPQMTLDPTIQTFLNKYGRGAQRG